MEGAPSIIEDDSDEKESRESRNITREPVRPGKPERSWFSFAKPEAEKPEPDHKVPEKPALNRAVETENALPEAEPVPEAEAPLEQIGADETPVIEQQLVMLNRELEAGSKPELEVDPEAAAADQAVEDFRDLVADGAGSEKAYNEIMYDLGAETTLDEAGEETVQKTPDSTGVELPDFSSGEISAYRSPDIATRAEADPDDLAITKGTGALGSVPSAASGSGQGTGNMPPNGPPTPVGTEFGPVSPSNFNTNATLVTEPPEPPEPERYYRGNPAAAALVGGVIGYLIGRRRGRIKTEKKLLPVQKKLEKQVDSLQWQLQDKEAKIRRAAIEQAKSRSQALTEKTLQAEEEPDEHLSVQNQEAPKAPEHIGHMLITGAEAEPAEAVASQERPAVETRPSKTDTDKEKPTDQLPRPANDKQVEALSRAELLALSEKINVGDSSLHQIYETHLVGERGLRRLVAEYMAGGDLKKALRREVVEREIDFERDPVMRDVKAVQPASTSSSKTLDAMLEKAAIDVNDGAEEAAFFKARATYEAGQLHQHKQQRHLIDIALAGFITLLVVTIIILYISRG